MGVFISSSPMHWLATLALLEGSKESKLATWDDLGYGECDDMS